MIRAAESAVDNVEKAIALKRRVRDRAVRYLSMVVSTLPRIHCFCHL